ncbi:hypothetical protein BOX15_Mlig007047g1, partial [Macrostomum lignano]
IRSNQSEVVMATRSEYQKNYRNYTKKAAEEYQEHLRYRQLRKSAEFAHHDWAWSGVEVEDTATPSAASASPPHAVASGSPPKQKAATAAETELKLTDLPPSRRLSKAEPSLSTLSQSARRLTTKSARPTCWTTRWPRQLKRPQRRRRQSMRRLRGPKFGGQFANSN